MWFCSVVSSLKAPVHLNVLLQKWEIGTVIYWNMCKNAWKYNI